MDDFDRFVIGKPMEPMECFVSPMRMDMFSAVVEEFDRIHAASPPASYKERLTLFAAFVSVLGPSDGAGLLALRRLRERGE